MFQLVEDRQHRGTSKVGRFLCESKNPHAQTPMILSGMGRPFSLPTSHGQTKAYPFYRILRVLPSLASEPASYQSEECPGEMIVLGEIRGYSAGHFH